MQGTLLVTTTVLISTANNFENTSGTVQNTTNSMLDIVNGMTSVGLGDAARTYIDKFQQLQDDMEIMYRMIQEHVRDLPEMARNYESAEREALEQINQLKTDAISY